MAIAKSLMTAEEFIQLPRTEGRLELVGGQVVEMAPVRDRHGGTQVRLSTYMYLASDEGELGHVFVEVGFRLARDPDTVRAPDVAYVSRARLPEYADSFVEGAPDIAAEVLSPDERPADVQRKVREYLAAGARLVWVVNLQRRTVTVYAPSQPERILRAQDVLSGEDILPAFQMRIEDLLKE